MEINRKRIGETIRNRREELGKTRREVCRGICDESTLFRIENGKRSSSPHVMVKLLERLGYPKEMYLDMMFGEESRIAELEDEIKTLNVSFEKATAEERPEIRKKALVKHAELEAIISERGKGNNSSWQAILRSRELLGKEDGPYILEESLALLIDAIRLTVPDFDIDSLQDNLYCETELRIVTRLPLPT